MLAAAIVGAVKFDYAANGGAFTGTKRTLAQMQALPDLLDVTQLRIRDHFNSGAETAIASVDDITIEAISAGSLSYRRRRRM